MNLASCVVLNLAYWQMALGFIYQIKSNGALQARCYTNESDTAVAFTRNLALNGKKPPSSSPVEYTPIIEGEKFTGAPCHLPSNCYNWMKPNFTKEQSLYSKFELPPVFDRRWNGFPEFVIPANSNPLKIFDNTTNNASGVLHLSILALESVQVVFSWDVNYNNVVLVKLGERVVYADGKNYAVYSEIKSCINFLGSGEFCTSLAKKWHLRGIKMSGTAWNLFSFNYKSHPDYFELSIKHNSGNILDPIKIYHNSRSSAAWKVGARSINTPALFKVHSYLAIRPKYRGQGKMKTEVSVTSHAPKICLELTYFYYKRASNESIAVTITNSKNKIVTTANLERNTEDYWKIEKVKTAALPQGKYSISVNIIPAAAYLGAINSCSNGKEIVTSRDTDVIGCQLLGKSHKKSGGDIELTDENVSKSIFNAFPGVTYSTAATAIERDGRNITNTPLTVNFTTCIQIDKNNTRVDVGTSLQVNITQDPGVCGWESLAARCGSSDDPTELTLENSNQVLKNLSLGDVCEIIIDRIFAGYYIQPQIFTTHTTSPRHSSSIPSTPTREATTGKPDLKPMKPTSEPVKTSTTKSSIKTTKTSTPKVNYTSEPTTAHSSSTSKISTSISISKASTDNDDGTSGRARNDDHTERIIAGGDLSSKPGDDKIGSKIAIGAAVLVVLGAMVLALLLWRRKRNSGQRHRLVDESATITKGGDIGNELKVLTIPEHVAAACKEELTKCESCLVPLEGLEPYIEEALRTDWLKQQHESFPRGQTRPWVVGSQPTNKAKNRYGNLTAYDATRVVLDLVPGDPYSDYINANYIDGYNQPNAYIATQGPKPQTVLDFWRMVWQEHVNVVVMVANCIETGKNKCEKYWPDQQKSLSFGDFTIKNVGEELFADYTCRDLVLSKDENNRKITHMHFTTWPDHHVPLYPQSLAEFTRKTIQIPTDSPIVVHCSAGVGRTGTYILVDACVRMAASEGSVDILGIFGRMRQHRPNMVDNHEQYKFAHRVLYECLVLPQFALPSSDFEESLKDLRSKNKSKLRKNYTRLSEICKSEWAGKRIQSGMAMESDKCRYPEFTACSSHLVQMFPYGDGALVSFVNAVYVDGFRQKSQFVATQVPMAHTVEHFWRLVHQHRTDWIIVLNEPAGKQCKPEGIYLPDQGGCLVLADLKIVAQDEKTSYGDLVCTIFQNDVKQGTVNVIQHQGWTARNSSGSSAEDLVNLWEDTQRRLTKSTTFVVCHDGVTACGLFLGIGFVLEKLKLEQQVDAAMATRILRLVRPQFIRNYDQYEMLYEAALVYLQNFDNYGNFQ